MKVRHQAEQKPGSGETEALDNDVSSLKEAVQKISDERDQLRDQLLRTMADFQNFRKRQDDQRKQLEAFATERFVTSLLPVIDNFERALASFESGATKESILEGLEALDRQFRQVLESQNVSKIPAVGFEFDPELHEALATESSDQHDDNTVIGELEPGYRMGEKVIRPARVRVAKKP